MEWDLEEEMKNKNIVMASAVVLALSILLVLGLSNKAKLADQPKLTLKISPLKQSYVLGEVVSFDVKVTNIGDTDVVLRGWTAETGYIKFLISGGNQKFKEYAHSDWRHGHKPKAIKAGETKESVTDLLWNFSPVGRVADLRGVYENHIMTELAFPEPSVYFIKAVLIIPTVGDGRAEFESEPVQIVVNEPVGEDINVWNRIRKNPDLAYFMQQGEVRSAKQEEREKLVKEVEQILADNPNSFLAGEMSKSLEKHRASEAKRKEFLENLKRRQQPSN